MSQGVTDAYSRALNHLLADRKHHVSVGENICCFWSDDDDQTTDLVSRMFESPDPQAVKEILRSPQAGALRPAAGEFHSCLLGGNGGRVVVRGWSHTPVACARANLRAWFSDLELCEIRPEKKTAKSVPPLALWRLAKTTVREGEKIRPEIFSQLFRAALDGTCPSIALLSPILARLRADLVCAASRNPLGVSRFALIKMICNRTRKATDPMMAPQLSDNSDVAYNCGRLLAILSETQARAHGWQLRGPGVVERYFGRAMSSPAHVFPLLLRLNRHHLEKIGREGSAKQHIEQEIGIICGKMDLREGVPQFPPVLDLLGQGRFALGFYQQLAFSAARRAALKDEKTAKNAENKPQERNTP